MVSITSLNIGQTISFTSKELFDQTTHTGKIVAIGGYDLISKYVTDIIPRYQAMRKTDPTMDPVQDLVYLVITETQNGRTGFYVIAQSWVNEASVSIVDTNKYFDVRVLNKAAATDATAVITILNEHGYLCKMINSN